MGTVITFYSYKGGVGRTMALANIAAILSTWGKKVLIVDWDLEAPGVENFFFSAEDQEELRKREGVVDLLGRLAGVNSKTSCDAHWEDLVVHVPVPRTEHSLDLITAGCRSSEYFKHVRELDISGLYGAHDGGAAIEALRSAWKARYDFVLVDSRTGVTDIGGICTIQLPDILTLVFTGTRQSLYGVLEVSQKASIERQKLPFDRAVVPSVPLPSRFDTQTEHKIAQSWIGIFETALKPLYDSWLPTSLDRRAFIELTKIPYSSYFSFGEELAVQVEGASDPAGIGYAYKTLAALFGNELQNIEGLLSNREEYLLSAQSPYSIIKMGLRDLPPSPLLAVHAVDAITLKSSLPASDYVAVIARFQQGVLDLARQFRGTLASSTGESMLFSFDTVADAVLCSISIRKRFAVGKPLVTKVGRFKIRLGIDDPSSVTDPDLPLAVMVGRIASTADADDLLVSERAVEMIDGGLEGVTWIAHGEINWEDVVMPDVVATEPTMLFRADFGTSIQLLEAEYAELLRQADETKGSGGFQAFLVSLKNRVDSNTKRLTLTISDLERIARYAHDYKGGGWQGRLRRIFGRTLGSNLGRE